MSEWNERVLLCKEKLLNVIGDLASGESKNTKVILRTLQSPNLVKKYFFFIKAVHLADELHYIEKSTESLKILISVLYLFSEFFQNVILRTPDVTLKQLDQLAAENGITKQEISVAISRQFVHPNKVYLWKKRSEDEQALQIQLLFRDELKRANVELPEIEINPELELDAKILDLDEACTIIQNAERMYQSISRYHHLLDVYQKALDLQAEERKTDPLKAVVKIQAITRGYLTRKKVRELRESTHMNLGLTTKALIASIAENRKTVFLKNLSVEELSFEKPLPEVFCQDIIELDDFIKDHFYKVDPLLDKFQNEEKQNLNKIDGFAENLLAELFLAEAIKLESNIPKFDNLISQTVFIKMKGKICHVDLRNFLYSVVVIPFCLQQWKIGGNRKRNNILIIGDSGSGKSVWTNSLCEKCLATKIRISRQLFMKKFMRRKKLIHTISQFVKIDKYAIVEFDKLEMFGGKKPRKTPIKAIILKLLNDLSQRNCQIIGLSRTSDLTPEVLSAFDYFVTIKNPIGIDRYALLADSLAQKHIDGRLQNPPKRLIELFKSTKKLSSGKTIAKVNSKFTTSGV